MDPLRDAAARKSVFHSVHTVNLCTLMNSDAASVTPAASCAAARHVSFVESAREYPRRAVGNFHFLEPLGPLEAHLFEPNPVGKKYSMITDFIEYSIKTVAPTTTTVSGRGAAVPC